MGAAASSSPSVLAEALKPLDASDVATPRGESAKAEVVRLRALLAEHTKQDPALAPVPGAVAVPDQMAKLVAERELWTSSGRPQFHEWLSRTAEEALEPELPIVDPHHHLWDSRDFKGMNPWGIFKQQYYMTDDLIDDVIGGGHNVTHTVFVSTHAFFSKDLDPSMAPLGEIQFVQGAAAQFASGKYGPLRACAGIVGGADLQKLGAEVEPLLVACKAASPNYRGIRVTAGYDSSLQKGNFAQGPGMYAEAKFREGFALLEKHGLLFDAWCFSSQLSDVHDLAKAFPATTIVLNHCGTPVAGLGDLETAPACSGKQGEIIAQWKADITRIATECPNVVVKVGGFGLPHLGHALEQREAPVGSEELAEMIREPVMYTIEAFGAGRAMLEGNFPVDKVSCSYTVLWNAFKRLTAGLPAEDRALLFSGTAKKVYRLA